MNIEENLTKKSPLKFLPNYLQDITNNDYNSEYQKMMSKSRIPKKIPYGQENINKLNFIGQRYTTGKRTTVKKSSKQILAKDQQQSVKNNIMTLPNDIHLEILKYLTPSNIICKIQFINKYWYQLCNQTQIWGLIHQIQSLGINEKYAKKMCIVERRSKGKLFTAVSRLTGDKYIIRKINVCTSNAGSDDGIPTSILREITYMNKLNHINISKIVDVSVNKEIVQIVTEYQEYNIKDYLKNYNKFCLGNQIGNQIIKSQKEISSVLPLKMIKIIAFQMLKGLQYLHHNGIIHRNLKSDNILINKNLNVKIADFSLSRAITIPHIPYTPEDPKDRERSGRESRRLWYRAPELLMRKNLYSFEVDIWSFGCLLAEISTNSPLFNGETEIEQLFKIFKLTGSPCKSMWSTLTDQGGFSPIFPSWPSVYLGYAAYSQNTQEFQTFQNVLLPQRESSFNKLIEIGKQIGVVGLDLLSRCLTSNPQLRITASSALQHQFFDDVRDELVPLYIHQTCCFKSLCQEIQQQSSSNSNLIPQCHILSYYNSLKILENEFSKKQNFLKIQSRVGNFLTNQNFANETMRRILVDWLIDVGVHFEIAPETLHLSIAYVDRYLGIEDVNKSKLQLVGVTCMKIADVLNEKSKEYYKQENASEYAYITAEEYTSQQLIELERQILNSFNFKLNQATAMHFLKIYILIFQVEESIAITSQFIGDLMLMSFRAQQYEDSLLASVYIFLACKHFNKKLNDDVQFNNNKQYFNCYTIKQFEECLLFVRDETSIILQSANFSGQDAVIGKYQKLYGVDYRSLVLPAPSNYDIKQWFYTKNH